MVATVAPLLRPMRAAAAADHGAAIAAQRASLASQAGADLVAVRNEFVAQAECVVAAGLLGIDGSLLGCGRGGSKAGQRQAGQQADGAERGPTEAVQSILSHVGFLVLGKRFNPSRSQDYRVVSFQRTAPAATYCRVRHRTQPPAAQWVARAGRLIRPASRLPPVGRRPARAVIAASSSPGASLQGPCWPRPFLRGPGRVRARASRTPTRRPG